MIEMTDMVTVESTMIETVTLPSEVYENLIRESERMRILRNYFWFTVEEYSSSYSIDNKIVAAVFDDEELLFGHNKTKFTEKIAKLVHDASDPKERNPHEEE